MHKLTNNKLFYNTVFSGRLLTGDCKKHIHLWEPENGGTWRVDQRSYVGHTDSVEDIQWSPNETNVSQLDASKSSFILFISCICNWNSYALW